MQKTNKAVSTVTILFCLVFLESSPSPFALSVESDARKGWHDRSRRVKQGQFSLPFDFGLRPLVFQPTLRANGGGKANMQNKMVNVLG